MGLSHGRLLAEEIRSLLRAMDRHIFRRIGPLGAPALRVAAHGLSLTMDRRIPPRMRDEMKAVAAGSATSYLDILLLNSLDDVLNVLRRLAPRGPSLGCSSFALFGSRTFDGALIHGRNLDYHFRGTPIDDGGAVSRLLLAHSVLFVFRPEGRARFLSVAWPGFVGTVTGLSERGISLGNLTSYLRGTSPCGLPVGLMYRTVLEEAESLADAARILGNAPRTIGNNVVIGSGRENRAALFEITRGEMLEPRAEAGMVVATNHFVSPGLARRQQPYLIPHSLARWDRLLRLCDRQGVTLQEALSILADRTCQHEAGLNSPFARVANEGTAVSALFRPTDMEMWLGVAPEPPASGGEFQRIDGWSLLRGPTSPLGCSSP